MSLRLVILLLLIVIGQAADVLSVGPFAQVFEIQPSISNLDMCDYLKNITGELFGFSFFFNQREKLPQVYFEHK